MANSVTVGVTGGPSVVVAWDEGMTAHQALEGAYAASGGQFQCGLQYYGANYGYLVFMISETYDTYASTAEPFFYWDFYVNGQPAPSGVDQTVLEAGDIVLFAFELYDPGTHVGSLLEVKHLSRRRLTETASDAG